MELVSFNALCTWHRRREQKPGSEAMEVEPSYHQEGSNKPLWNTTEIQYHNIGNTMKYLKFFPEALLDFICSLR